jgi:hypothetical protein
MKKKSKFMNKKTEINGIKFSSKKEATRYIDLKEKEKNGEITNLELQVKFNLQPSIKVDGETIRAIDYVSDFCYYEKNSDKLAIYVVEDVKASKFFQTDVFKIKRKLFAYKYGFKIREWYGEKGEKKNVRTIKSKASKKTN